ncbi:DUF2948 family protein [Amylibacter sp. SFDW26]|uniref:DUF2948 family protein n=1 Tax=Amylibacter sp. SFDW26 TaxID=2652722 RepID=UPI0012614FB1|nr:DUF2948 family protein [Amylibacter sp. SFDW26]KAB7613502.1 DUF2948 family protein [Amylibacter sp. SFDW26]
MTQQDAKFEDGIEQSLRLIAQDVDDLSVISTLIQDAVLPLKETSWQPSANRFGLLLNRFRWEDKTQAERGNRVYERVQAMLVVNNVLKVSSMGIDKSDKDQIISILSIDFKAGKDGEGQVIFTLAGDGALALDVECLDVTLKDVTKPYKAVSKSAPNHTVE